MTLSEWVRVARHKPNSKEFNTLASGCGGRPVDTIIRRPIQALARPPASKREMPESWPDIRILAGSKGKAAACGPAGASIARAMHLDHFAGLIAVPADGGRDRSSR